ncbi:major capsid protein (endogenous virus) [Gutovirus Vc1]|uniref:Major capsid protein n=1 Tax=Vibrio phage Vc1 TaxID=1480731 RepID=X2KT16_9CAUD|nr:major capsid protein [Vibrio phage Vc1]AHN84658.1 major capsid protein [Vibrio phage Vc1]
MSDANVLVDSKVSASGEAKSLAIEKYNGQVRRAYHTNPNMMQYFDLEMVTGTNVVSNKYLGVTQVQALAPGKDVRGGEVQFDKNSLVIDTTLISRNIVGILDDVQDDIQTKGKLAEEQVSALQDLENRMLLQQGIYGAISNTKAKRTTPRVKGQGFSTIHTIKKETALGNPLMLMAGIEWLIEDMMVQNVDISKITIFMPWQEFNCLRDAERIVDARYNTASGSTVTGFVLKSFNVPIVPSNHFPNKARDHADIDGNDQEHHLLSNANNAYRYDVKTGDGVADGEDMEQCAALVIGREGLLVGRSINLMGKIWENDANKSWYIDTWMAEGAIPDRWEHLAALIKTDKNSEAGLDARYKRKVMPMYNLAGSVPESFMLESGSPAAMRQAPQQDPEAFAAAVAIALQALVKPTALKPEAKEALGE